MNLAQLFPAEVVVVSATPEMWTTPLLHEEELLIREAISKRQREFRAGRHCARTALAELGLPKVPILRDEKRAPIWPPGYLGSISHCDDYCLAACCAIGSVQGLGVDVEPLAPLNSELAGYIHSKTETAFMHAHPELPPRIIFSAKESLYKCFYPLVKRFFGFHAVELHIDLYNQCFSFISTGEISLELPEGVVFHGSYLIHQGHLVTGCYLIRA